MPGLELSFLISQESTGRGNNPLYTNQYPFYIKGREIDRMTNEPTSVKTLASSDLSQDETRYQLSSQSPCLLPLFSDPLIYQENYDAGREAAMVSVKMASQAHIIWMLIYRIWEVWQCWRKCDTVKYMKHDIYLYMYMRVCVWGCVVMRVQHAQSV